MGATSQGEGEDDVPVVVNLRLSGSRGGRAPVWGVLALALVAPAMVGCVGGSGAAPGESTWPGAVTVEYLPGLAADIHPPTGASEGPVPVVLLVPGGGWQTADRSGLSPLAAELAQAGMFVVNATYSTGRDGAMFPEPVQDVICAGGFAVAQAQAAGLTPGPLVMLGHSAGGHLAALAATTGPDLTRDCPDPIVAVGGLVGLAGVYDTASFEFALVDFFGTTRAEAPGVWATGDAIARVSAGMAPPGLRVLLRHGDSDEDVPLAQSQAFASALESEGVPVQLDVLPEVDHAEVYTAEVSAAPVIAWITTQWPDSPGQQP